MTASMVYRSASRPRHERVADLLARMTPAEKIGQISQPVDGWKACRRQGDTVEILPEWQKLIRERCIGVLYGLQRADPWTQVRLESGLWPRHAASAVNAVQRLAVEGTRLGIPLLFCEEAPHGHQGIGSTVFPCNITLGRSWNSDLARRVGAAIGRETAARGVGLSFGPICDLALDPRWSRCEECYGEDPVHAGVMAAAMVHGIQEDGSGGRVGCTLKHYVGYGNSQGGHNCGPAHFGPRELRATYLPPFASAVEAGAMAAMGSYNAVDGIPVCANRYLINDVLRGELGFRGVLMGDGSALDQLHYSYHAAPTPSAAVAMCLTAGIDLSLWDEGAKGLADELTSGRLTMATLDRAVSQVLDLKFRLGLFEHPFIEESASVVVGSSEHRTIALEAAVSGLVLLKNEALGGHPALPLPLDLQNLAVVGPNADSPYNQLGDYTAPQADGSVITPLAALRHLLPECNLRFEPGCRVCDPDPSGVPAAVAAARAAGLCVAFVGGSSARDFNACFANTGAVDLTGGHYEMECGEGVDRCTLGLPGAQQAMLEAIHAAGVPIIAVIIAGRPLALPWLAKHAVAIIDAGYPGCEGGTAIAKALFGLVNPAGRLAMSVARDVGCLPAYYHHQTGWRDYFEGSHEPLWAFGHGLSYTTFAYEDLQCPASAAATEGLRLSVGVRNTGARAGDEVVQAYLHIDEAPFARPDRRLVSFARVPIEPGKFRRVELTLPPAAFCLPNADGRLKPVHGTVTIGVGGSLVPACEARVTMRECVPNARF